MSQAGRRDRPTESSGSSRSIGSTQRAIRNGTGGAALVAVLILMLAPVASASSVRAATYTTPFAGELDDSSFSGTNGCGASSIVKAPTFNLTTGVGKGAINASTNNCAPNLNGNYGDASEQFGLASANFTTTSGTHTVSAKWSLHWTMAVKVVVPTGKGTIEAIATVSVQVLIWDSTNFSVVVEKSWFRQHTGFVNTSFSSTGNQTASVTASATLVSGHVYYIYVTAYIFTYANVGSSPGASAFAKVDVASGKNRALLQSYSFV